jgi:hypothetical protein
VNNIEDSNRDQSAQYISVATTLKLNKNQPDAHQF